MRAAKRNKPAIPADRPKLMDTYRQLVASVREARSLQTLLEKERQMRCLMHYMQRV